MSNERRQITLPSGTIVEVRRGKGRDLMRAHRAVAGNPEPMSLSFALIAELTEVEGKPLVYEDILEMAIDDVLTLEETVSGAGKNQENFSLPAALESETQDFPRPRQSSDSSVSGFPSASYK
jgi:hypothetical protein